MSLNRNEQMLSEAIKNMLDDTALGVDAHKGQDEERANTFTFLHEEIEQAYRLETIDLDHQESVCSAFAKIHSHKYLDDPSFALSFKKEMTARAVPMEDMTAALEAMGKIKEKMLAEKDEKDAGWNPDLDEIVKISQPPQIDESIIKDTDNYSHEHGFYRDKDVRKWIDNKQYFWEAVDKRIKPFLEEIGCECTSNNAFWEAYDNEAIEYVIRARMHELFEEIHADYQANAK